MLWKRLSRRFCIGEDRKSDLRLARAAAGLEGLESRRLLAGDGLKAEYFANADLTGPSVTRVDPSVNFHWEYNSPDAAIGPDTFSARWTGQIQPQFSENYTFATTGDDGIRLWVNDQQIINDWQDHSPTGRAGTIELAAGQKYDIRMEYYE